jgi:peroxiredoxin
MFIKNTFAFVQTFKQLMYTTFKALLLLLVLPVFVISCQDNNNDYTAYFGGEVQNPRTDYIVLSKGNDVIDTILLDKNNRFFVKFDSLAPGLYTFRHEPEYQYVYFEKNDSLLVSIDADNFDESVVFSGRGDRKNNFLIELYLMNENDRNKSYPIYEYGYDKFIAEINKSYAAREAFYNESKKKIEWSDDFDFYAQSRLKFSQYTKKEYYPYLHAWRTGNNIRASLPKNYYSHRNEIDYNNPKLVHFSPFLRYVNAMLSNMSNFKGKRSNDIDENSLNDNIEKLHIADSVFTDEKIKNEILDNIAFAYLLENQSSQNNKKFIEHYIKLSTRKNKDNEITRLAASIKNLEEGNALPQVKLVDRDNKPFELKNAKGKETVIFFWTTCAPSHYSQANDKVSGLKKQFPDVNFIAVNVDEMGDWADAVKNLTCKDIIQLRADDFTLLRKKWAINQLNRTIILNADGTIKNGFTNLTDERFADNLK